MSNNLHFCLYSCFNNLLCMCNGTKVDTFIPQWASSQPWSHTSLLAIRDQAHMNIALVRFSVDLWVAHSIIVKVSIALLDLLSSFSFHFHSFISFNIALAIAFDCILFKYSSEMTPPPSHMSMIYNHFYFWLCSQNLPLLNITRLWSGWELSMPFHIYIHQWKKKPIFSSFLSKKN